MQIPKADCHNSIPITALLFGLLLQLTLPVIYFADVQLSSSLTMSSSRARDSLLKHFSWE
jgi:hypothetical protein